MRLYPSSTKLLERARRLTPLGTQTRSKAASAHVEGAAPAFVERAYGCRFWDVDGHEYIDYSMGLSAVALGHCHSEVDEAVIAQIYKGASYSLASRLEADVAEALCEIVPCAESVRFVKTGSEATEAAMRIARVATGRDVIVSIGYHGWHSVHDAAKVVHPGVPKTMSADILDVAYNDLDQLGADLIPDGAVAAVLIEPVLHDAPAPGYLATIRELCTRHGALLIFDEVVSGFRWALGGAGEYFGVSPDLACFGKAMANGYPLAAVVGRRDLMDAGAPYVSSTFGGEAVSLAAAKATIGVFRRDDVIRHLWAIGGRLQHGFNDAVGVWSGALPIVMSGYPVKPVIRIVPTRQTIAGWEHPTETQRRTLLSIFLQECADRGVFFHAASNNVSLAHTPKDIDETLTAVSGAAHVCLEAMSADDPSSFLRGRPYRTLFDRVPS